MARVKQDYYGRLQSNLHQGSQGPDGLLSTKERQEEDREDTQCSMRRGAVAWKGFALVLLNCLLSAINSMLIKMLADRISTIEVTFFRQMSLVIYLSPPLMFQKISMKIERKDAPFIALWILSSTISVCCAYYALEHILAGDAVAIIFSTPIFTGIIGWIFLREKLTMFNALLVVLTIIGIVLIARPSFIFVGLDVPQHGNVALGLAAALTTTVSSSVSTVLMRKLGKTNIHPVCQLWLSGVVGGVLIAIVASSFNVWTLPRCGMERIIFIVSGFLAVAAHLPLLYAARIEKAVNVAMFRTNMVIFTFVLEFVIFGVVPFYLSLIGTVLIISSSLGTTTKKWNTTKRMSNIINEPNGDSEYADTDQYSSVVLSKDN